MDKSSASRSMFEDVKTFHDVVLGVPPTPPYSFHSEAWMLERYRFLMEEVTEFYDCAHAGDMVGAVDGLLDTVYVALGTLHLMGMTNDQVQACWDAIQKANMGKVRGTTKRGNLVDAAKPANWVGPETTIAAVLGGGLDATKP